MDRLSTFFRVFDVAFFAPGVLLLLAFWYAAGPTEFAPSLGASTVVDAIVVTLVLALTYILGLMCHGVQRIAYTLFGRRIVESPRLAEFVNRLTDPQFAVSPCKVADDQNSAAERSAYKETDFQNVQAEWKTQLTQYFWYMRSTCWNLAAAIAIGAAYAQVKGRMLMPGGWILVGAAILVFLFAGFDFHRAMRKGKR